MAPLAALALVADQLFTGGVVLTMDAASRTAEAVAVREGRILAVGSMAEISKLRGPATKITNVAGGVLLPGFFAAHDHFPASGAFAITHVDLNSPPIGRMESVADIVAALRERAARTPKGQWVLGRGYDDTLIRERRHPNRRDLDAVSPDHPVWIVHTSGHLGAANSAALRLAGIGRETANPRGGVIRKDAVGEPDGVIEESLGLVGRRIPGATREQRVQAVAAASRGYLARGVTTAVVAGGTAESLATLRDARERGVLGIRVVQMLSAAAEYPSGGDDQVRPGAIKMTQDGSIQGYTGYLGAPYHRVPEGAAGGADFRGYPSRPRAELTAAVTRLHRAGRQIAIHANGDAAIDDVLEAFATAQRTHPRSGARHRIEHCQTAREDQLDRMRELGVTPSFFNGHVYYWGDRHRDLFLGPARAARISPLASALRRGIRFTLHNDTPVTPVDPLMLVWTAVTRRTRAGEVLGPDQRISVLEALRAVTIDAAWQNFEEPRCGSIEPGKLADFVVLAENPLTAPPDRIKDIPVRMTVVGGVITRPE